MSQNIGRDVSKFFYGGYSLESYVTPHHHSNKARIAVNSLIIGVLEKNVDSRIMKVKSSTFANNNESIRTIKFEQVKEDVSNNKVA